MEKDYIRRASTDFPYVIIPNALAQDVKLTPESKGVLVIVLSLPKDWVINKEWIMKKYDIGRRVLDRIFKELEDIGYLITFPILHGKGKYPGKGYIFYPESVKKEQSNKINQFNHVQNVHGIHVQNVHLQIQEKQITQVTNLKSKRVRDIISEEDLFKKFEEADKKFGVPKLPNNHGTS